LSNDIIRKMRLPRLLSDAAHFFALAGVTFTIYIFLWSGDSGFSPYPRYMLAVLAFGAGMICGASFFALEVLMLKRKMKGEYGNVQRLVKKVSAAEVEGDSWWPSIDEIDHDFSDMTSGIKYIHSRRRLIPSARWLILYQCGVWLSYFLISYIDHFARGTSIIVSATYLIIFLCVVVCAVYYLNTKNLGSRLDSMVAVVLASIVLGLSGFVLLYLN